MQEFFILIYFFFFTLYLIARNKTSHEPITPTKKLRMSTRSWIKNPYRVHISVPAAKITKVTIEIFSADFVLYNLYAWGKYPIDITMPTIVVSTWKIFIIRASVMIEHQEINFYYDMYIRIGCNMRWKKLCCYIVFWFFGIWLHVYFFMYFHIWSCRI
jgi:hypothetical protein